jgi:hypothetical protein
MQAEEAAVPADDSVLKLEVRTRLAAVEAAVAVSSLEAGCRLTPV